jgi:hypothetical protein
LGGTIISSTQQAGDGAIQLKQFSAVFRLLNPAVVRIDGENMKTFLSRRRTADIEQREIFGMSY